MPVNFSLQAVVDQIVRQLWPPQCLLCGLPGDAAEDLDLCPACFAILPWSGPACRGCALPLTKADAGHLCGTCLQRAERPLAHVHASLHYAAPLDRLLPRFKFRQSLATGRLLARLMLRQPPAQTAQALIPIPLHRQRLRQRGYDQALELAKPLARHLRIPLLANTLLRHKPTLAQSTLDKAARRRNLRAAFTLHQKSPLPEHVLLLDDVMTTGATLESAAQCLLRAGVKRVDAWVCARA